MYLCYVSHVLSRLFVISKKTGKAIIFSLQIIYIYITLSPAGKTFSSPKGRTIKVVYSVACIEDFNQSSNLIS